ncbi:BZ3500_MvSof-1268-A1-R1_Chr4-2g06934 [Microbotryum saponariae]|uniref:BZ3500_MvSof-1268-A1-R1_Chr4-2g06934 protein n=1 Tax=Microbotryum saponariae TaxID=289078 RepID=A0A2X0KSG0_9BASI|nr:BZ3500_MvSof-1268-A1-R1_Chr4-2g06934 [Microbotryum saponariae]SDA06599.1 BZ3501_MvSof-1269-A2-R1_Chr4-2g06645 [Microbotryum saponariae]
MCNNIISFQNLETSLVNVVYWVIRPELPLLPASRSERESERLREARRADVDASRSHPCEPLPSSDDSSGDADLIRPSRPAALPGPAQASKKGTAKRKADPSNAANAKSKDPKWDWTDAEVIAMLEVLKDTYESTGTQSFPDSVFIRANEAVSRLDPSKAGNSKKVHQKWKSCLVDTKLINDIRTATGIGWDEENCRPILNAEQWKTAIAKCARAAIIAKRPSNFYYPLTSAILGKDYATGSDGFSYGDNASTTTRTPAPHPGRRRQSSEAGTLELSEEDASESAGEFDEDIDPRAACATPLPALRAKSSTPATKKPRLSRDRASVQQRAIMQARREHLDNTLTDFQQTQEESTDRMIGHLDRVMLSDRDKFLEHFYKFEELDQSAWDTVVSYVAASGDKLPMSVVSYLVNLKTRWKPNWSAASEIIVEARRAKETMAFYDGNHNFDLPPMMHPMQ